MQDAMERSVQFFWVHLFLPSDSMPETESALSVTLVQRYKLQVCMIVFKFISSVFNIYNVICYTGAGRFFLLQALEHQKFVCIDGD